MKKLISIALILALVFSLTVLTMAAPDPVAGNPSKMDWKPAYKEVAINNTLEGYDYDRGNASGDKIPSNAHSADYAGLYFFWSDDKGAASQKEPGVLLVDPGVFDLFADGTFILTAKTSNCYWGYEISEETGTYLEDEDIYVYGIPRAPMYTDKKGKLVSDEMKNINMVFIDGEYKSANFEIEKVWFDANGFEVIGDDDLVSFKEGWKIGNNEVKINDFVTASKGKKVTVTEKAIAGFTTVSPNPQSLTVKCTDDPVKVVTVVNKEDPVTVLGKLSLDKWIDGSPAISYECPKGYKLSDFMYFEIYAATAAKNGYSATPLARSSDEYLDDSGVIFFDVVLTPGWYAVVEVLNAQGAKYFAQQPELYIYVSESDTTYAPEEGTVTLVSRADVEVFNMVTGDEGFTVVVMDEPGEWRAQMHGPAVSALLGSEAEFVWDVENTREEYGLSGSWIRVTDHLVIPGEIDGQVVFNVACDNAAILFINGEYVFNTDQAFKNSGAIVDKFGDLGPDDINGEPVAWSIVYDVDITEFLTPGSNEIMIYAANARHDDEIAPNTSYNKSGNPCGLIYSVEAGYKGVRFDNDTVDLKGFIEVVPMFSGDQEVGLYAGANPVWGTWTSGYEVFSAYDEVGGFDAPLTGAITPVWNKEQGAEMLGHNAYFNYTYELEGSDQELIGATDFRIFADNAFVLFINGQFVGASGNVAATTEELIAAYSAAGGDADLFFEGIERYNEDDYDGGKNYNFAITNADFDIEAILADAVAGGNVVIEIFAYNTPQRSDVDHDLWVPGRPNATEDNPACVIFACTFAYKYE